jgi:hypothetical protein
VIRGPLWATINYKKGDALCLVSRLATNNPIKSSVNLSFGHTLRTRLLLHQKQKLWVLTSSIRIIAIIVTLSLNAL